MLKLVLIVVLIAISLAQSHRNGRRGGCLGQRNATTTANSSSVTTTTAPFDGNGVIQARAQPVTTESMQIDTGVEIVDLNRN